MNLSSLWLSVASMRNRLLSTGLTLLSISLSVAVLLGVQRISRGARASFESTVADTDLIVGARSGPVQLLLYSVFHIGHATNNVSWASYRDLAGHEQVAWTVPLALGDSHRGFRVVGTNRDFFEHYKVGAQKNLDWEAGGSFEQVYEAVVGARVAHELAYEIGETITLAHGMSEVSFQEHADKPFTIVGVLAPTGTPIDRAVLISLEGLTAMHRDWEAGAPPLAGQGLSAEEAARGDLTPSSITAFLLGLHAKIGIFTLQRAVNEYEAEPLTAILPGLTFRELWETLGMAETALMAVAWLVVVAGLLGMVSAVLTTLGERRRELAILRALGARPADVFLLLLSEAGMLGAGGSLLGLGLVYAGMGLARPWLAARFGLFLPLDGLSLEDLGILAAVVVAALLAGCLPAWKAYQRSLADGLSIKL